MHIKIRFAGGFDRAEYEIDLSEKEAVVCGEGKPRPKSFLNREVDERQVTALAMFFS